MINSTIDLLTTGAWIIHNTLTPLSAIFYPIRSGTLKRATRYFNVQLLEKKKNPSVLLISWPRSIYRKKIFFSNRGHCYNQTGRSKVNKACGLHGPESRTAPLVVPLLGYQIRVPEMWMWVWHRIAISSQAFTGAHWLKPQTCCFECHTRKHDGVTVCSHHLIVSTG